MFNMIAAVSQNGIIGINDTIPWKCKADMQYFKKTTMNNIVVMGRKTYDSLFNFMKDKTEEPLPGRTKFVLTRNPETMKVDHPTIFPIGEMEPGQFVKQVNSLHNKEVFVIGGSQIYKHFLGYYDRIYLTRIQCNYTPENKNDTVHYLPLTDNVLSSDYDLLYKDSHSYDSENESSMIFEQWGLKNLYGK